MRALMRFTSKALAEVYMRNLKHNNPNAAAHSYILKPSSMSMHVGDIIEVIEEE